MKTAILAGILVALVALFVAVESKAYKYHPYKPPYRPPCKTDQYYTPRCKHTWALQTYQPDCTCYIQCVWGKPMIRPCAAGTVWKSIHYWQGCVHGKKVGHRCFSKFKHSKGGYYYGRHRYDYDCNGFNYKIKDNFCSYKNKNYKQYGYKYKFSQYFEYPKDCSCFYQCDKSGNTHIRPCASGTVWDQSKLTCVRPCRDTCKGRGTPMRPRVKIIPAYCPKYYG